MVIGFGYWHFDIAKVLTLESLKSHQASLVSDFDRQPLFAGTIFFLVYVIATAVSLPGAAILTLGAGSIFGFWTGMLLVSFASTIGATLAFLASRFFLHHFVQRHFGDRINGINRDVKKEGAFYLLTLRLVPVFPFFLINLAMGLTPIWLTM